VANGKKVLLIVLVAAFAILAASPAVRWRVAGWWRGEPFAAGRPVSWWRTAIRDSHIFPMTVDTRRGEKRREIVFDLDGPVDGPGDTAHVSDGTRILLALLGDADPKVRYYAAQQLGRLDWAGRPALPALRAAASDTAEVMDGLTVSGAAAHAVWRIEDSSARGW
jgi:hypothetical protein